MTEKTSANVGEKQLVSISAVKTLVTRSCECWAKKNREQERELEWASLKKEFQILYFFREFEIPQF